MRQRSNIQKLTVALLLVALVQVTFAFTGSSDERNKSSKFTLKNLSRFSNKTFCGTTLNLNNNFKYQGVKLLNTTTTNTGTVEANTLVKYSNGSTTFVYPYKLKVKVPKFKTPTRPTN